VSRPDDEAFNLDAILGGASPETGGAQDLGPTGQMMAPPMPEPSAAPVAETPAPKRSLRQRLRGLDIFTVMLGLSLLALVIAVVMLVVELSRYQWDTSARSARQTVQSAVAASQHLV
jgi:hypothetical protein